MKTFEEYAVHLSFLYDGILQKKSFMLKKMKGHGLTFVLD